MGIEIESQMANSASNAQSSGGGSVLGTIGGGVLNAVTGGIGGLVANGIGAIGNAIFGKTQADKDAEQLKQQGALQQQQIQGSEQLTDYQRQSQLEYQQAQYAAQIKGMQENGLNPALIYGGSGGGGSTGGSAVTIGSGQAANTAEMTNAATNAASQTTEGGLQASQAAVNTATIPKIGAEIDNIGTETAKIGQETGNMQIAAIGMNTENQLKNIQLAIAKSTETDIESTVSQQLLNLTVQKQKLDAEIKGLTINNTTMLGSQQAIINKYNAEVKDIIAGIAVKYSDVKLNQSKAQEIANSIEQGWQKLIVESKGQDVSRENVNKMAETILSAAKIQAATQLVTTAANALIKQPTTVTNSTHQTTLDGEGNIKQENFGTTILNKK